MLILLLAGVYLFFRLADYLIRKNWNRNFTANAYF